MADTSNNNTNGVTVVQVKAPSSTYFKEDVNPFNNVNVSDKDKPVTLNSIDELINAIKSSWERFIESQRSYFDSSSTENTNSSSDTSTSSLSSNTTKTEEHTNESNKNASETKEDNKNTDSVKKVESNQSETKEDNKDSDKNIVSSVDDSSHYIKNALGVSTSEIDETLKVDNSLSNSDNKNITSISDKINEKKDEKEDDEENEDIENDNSDIEYITDIVEENNEILKSIDVETEETEEKNDDSKPLTNNDIEAQLALSFMDLFNEKNNDKKEIKKEEPKEKKRIVNKRDDTKIIETLQTISDDIIDIKSVTDELPDKLDFTVDYEESEYHDFVSKDKENNEKSIGKNDDLFSMMDMNPFDSVMKQMNGLSFIESMFTMPKNNPENIAKDSKDLNSIINPVVDKVKQYIDEVSKNISDSIDDNFIELEDRLIVFEKEDEEYDNEYADEEYEEDDRDTIDIEDSDKNEKEYIEENKKVEIKNDKKEELISRADDLFDKIKNSLDNQFSVLKDKMTSIYEKFSNENEKSDESENEINGITNKNDKKDDENKVEKEEKPIRHETEKDIIIKETEKIKTEKETKINDFNLNKIEEIIDILEDDTRILDEDILSDENISLFKEFIDGLTVDKEKNAVITDDSENDDDESISSENETEIDADELIVKEKVSSDRNDNINNEINTENDFNSFNEYIDTSSSIVNESFINEKLNKEHEFDPEEIIGRYVSEQKTFEKNDNSSEIIKGINELSNQIEKGFDKMEQSISNIKLSNESENKTSVIDNSMIDEKLNFEKERIG